MDGEAQACCMSWGEDDMGLTFPLIFTPQKKKPLVINAVCMFLLKTNNNNNNYY